MKHKRDVFFLGAGKIVGSYMVENTYAFVAQRTDTTNQVNKYRTLVEKLFQLEANHGPKFQEHLEKTTHGRFLPSTGSATGWEWGEIQCSIPNKTHLGPTTPTIIIIIIIIMSGRLHGYLWPSLATSPYRSSLPAGLQDYIPYPHIAAVCMFELVVPLLLGHMWGSIGGTLTTPQRAKSPAKQPLHKSPISSQKSMKDRLKNFSPIKSEQLKQKSEAPISQAGKIQWTMKNKEAHSKCPQEQSQESNSTILRDQENPFEEPIV